MATADGRPRATAGLVDLVDRILDKGLVINADIVVSVGNVELLGIRIRAALASFETAARYGMEFPFGTDLRSEAFRQAAVHREPCPQCGRYEPRDQLLDVGCPWCGWRSPLKGALRGRAALAHPDRASARASAAGGDVSPWLSESTPAT